jgi:subtilase family serine protease
MCGEYTPPKVLSVSYTDPEQYLPVNYVERQCNEWMKLALAGTTTLFASGDYGVSPYPGSFNSSSGCMVNPVTGARSVFGPSLWNGQYARVRAMDIH